MHWKTRRPWGATVLAAALVGSGMVGLPALAAPTPGPDKAPDAAAKISTAVSDQVESEGRADVWVRFAERPDLGQFASITDWDARGQAVYDALTTAAEDSQAEVRAELDDQGVAYHPFWATNSIMVGAADAELLGSLAAETEVEGIYPMSDVEIPDPVPATPVAAPSAIEWGIADVNAPQVWDELGVRGEGIVVGSIDTGAQFDHPALVDQYRGNNGDGSFDHNYNWFDAAGISPTKPVDQQGHGTHVTGTMVGSDGADNRIGVAPGATWIAANGCCPSELALVRSGQWMLAPTDLNGELPRPDLRPHVINNSWGSGVPSTQPIMEDVIEAWAASGQFGVFANGNKGPGCETAGSPGSRTTTYSVGNYTAEHVIERSSSRGPGQDGTIKPSIAAPGTAIRSAAPGGGYQSATGTSMASPHVAGAVALLWSGAPSLVGDVEATRALLDGTAIDTEDLQCGGTAEDNNVFGEGRLDALALLTAAPTAETGQLAGTVTGDGSPLSGVAIAFTGPVERTVRTSEDGTYRTVLSTGTYTMTVSAFGYQEVTREVAVDAGGSVTVDLDLERATTRTVTGTVSDGSGAAFPLYAKVAVGGTGLYTFTDPATGAYEMELPESATFTLHVEAQFPGYRTARADVVPGTATADVAVPVDHIACNAPGYHAVTDGTTEGFDGLTAPEGWQVVDHAGTGQVWAFDNPGAQDNRTGGEGGFAIMDSDHHGMRGSQDTSLVTPPFDLTGITSPALTFRQDFKTADALADVDVSTDGGETWTTLLSQASTRTAPDLAVVDLPQTDGEVQLRFHYWLAEWDYWWAIDDVFVGSRSCVPTGEGGYVVGTVTDPAGEGVVGATVTNLDVPEETTLTTATPSDAGTADGFYWLFSQSRSTQPFEATARTYGPTTQEVTVADGTVRADFVLGQGVVSVEPDQIEVTQQPDEVGTSELTLTNTGTSSATVRLDELVGGHAPADVAEPTTVAVEADTAELAAPISTDGAVLSMRDTLAAQQGPAADAEAVAPGDGQWWRSLPDYPGTVVDAGMTRVGDDVYVLGGGDVYGAYLDVFRLADDLHSWEYVTDLPDRATSAGSSVGTIDGEVVVSGGWSQGSMRVRTDIWDVETNTWRQGTPAPVDVSQAGNAVLDGELYSVGGCEDTGCGTKSSAVMRYTPGTDTWETLADYPAPTGYLACGVTDEKLVCAGGLQESGGVATGFAYDPIADSWSPIPDAPNDFWAAASTTANNQLVVNGGLQDDEVSNRTFAYDGASATWLELAPSGTPTYRGTAACGVAKVGGRKELTGTDRSELLAGYDHCGAVTSDVEWLTLDQDSVTVPAGGSATVTVTTDSTGLEDGTYTAAVRVRTDTGQRLDAVPVTLHVDRADLTVDRVAGENRYATAAAVAGAFEPGVGTVFLATGLDYPDALAGSALAGSLDVPVLLTRPGGLPAATRAELVRLQPASIVVLGGTASVSDDVAADATALTGAPVRRLAGANRYATAAAVAAELDGGGRVFVATGRAFPDALAAAARAGALDRPVLLVQKDWVPAATAAALAEMAPAEITVLGGESVVSDAVLHQLDAVAPTSRVGGLDRYGSAVKVSQELTRARTVFVASGTDWPDALAGSALAGSTKAPLLLTRPEWLPTVTAEEIARLDPDRIVVLGGTAAVSQEVADRLGTLRPMR